MKNLAHVVAVLLATAGLLGAGPPPPRSGLPTGPKLYALLVGIGQYAYENPPHDDADIAPLDGPGRDVRRVRAVLADIYGLDPQRTIELADGQATRQAIGKALDELIVRAAADPGSTLLFYYSGHGGQIRDATGRQISGTSSTIVPYDARQPGRLGDILDLELKPVLDAATSWGVNVVTIFDSCNSATATRGARLRHARAARAVVQTTPLTLNPLPLPEHPTGTAPAARPGLRVHLAAAQDGEAAGESKVSGDWRGDFTEALAGALQEDPNATYEDIARAVQLKLRTQNVPQHPHAEGALLTRVFGGDADDLKVYEAFAADDGGYVVVGGTLAGVTAGSTFNVFGSVKAARAGSAIGQASVVSADLASGRLDVRALTGSRPKQLYLLEREHNFGADRLAVQIQSASPAAATRLRQSLEGLQFVTLVSENPQVVVEQTGAAIRLLDPAGTPLEGDLGRGLSETELRTGLQRVARYAALLALAKPEGGPEVRLQVERDCADKPRCAPVELLDGDAVLDSGEHYHLLITNNDRQPLYVYVFDLGSDFSVQPVFAPARSQTPGEIETSDRLRPGSAPLVVDQLCAFYPTWAPQPAKRGTATLQNEDHDYILLIATDAEIPAWALAQDGLTRPRGQASPLAAIMAQAYSGDRGPVVAPVSKWTVRVQGLRTRWAGRTCD